MGLFATNKAVELLRDRLQGLETEVETLKRERRGLDLEFTELYDKVSHQMSRMAKRHAAAAKNNGEDLGDETPQDEFSHLDPISRSIMVRRANGGLQR